MGRGLCCIKKEGKKIKTEEKIEGDLAANIIIVLLGWRLSVRSILRLCKPGIGNYLPLCGQGRNIL